MPVYFSHATSFCGAVWDPVRAAFGDIETVAFDQLGHGNAPKLETPVHWSQFGRHILDVTDPGGVGVGHSMGAAALAMAQIEDPDRFKALVLIEPVMFPGPYKREDRNQMSDTALRRRMQFESRSEAVEHFRGRGAFEGWDEAALEGYVRCGLVGEGPVTLACDPEVEADIYRGSRDHDTWERLGQIEIPVLVMSGEHSTTISPRMARDQADQFPRAGLEVVEGAGHFLPMEMPGLVAERVQRMVEAVN